eukprot:1399512-Pleurochrysis_carterae.AAC.2
MRAGVKVRVGSEAEDAYVSATECVVSPSFSGACAQPRSPERGERPAHEQARRKVPHVCHFAHARTD